MKVNENLRRTWAAQREQMIEEREFTQSGEPRSPEGIAAVDLDVRVMDRLLSLPLGATFDGQEIHRQVAEESR